MFLVLEPATRVSLEVSEDSLDRSLELRCIFNITTYHLMEKIILNSQNPTIQTIYKITRSAPILLCFYNHKALLISSEYFLGEILFRRLNYFKYLKGGFREYFQANENETENSMRSTIKVGIACILDENDYDT